MKRAIVLTCLLPLAYGWAPSWAADPNGRVAQPESAATLAQDVEALKAEVLSLSRELEVIEESLLFPASTQIAVFLSLDQHADFDPSSVQVFVDDQPVTSHIYTLEEIEALKRGGAQRLYMGNLPSGLHRLKAAFIGRRAAGDLIQAAQILEFTKDSGKKHFEIILGITDQGRGPGLTLRELR